MDEGQEADLTYDGLNDFFKMNPKGTIIDRTYMAFMPITNKSFIMFLKKMPNEGACPEGKLFKKHGLKFHVSLPEFDRTMYKKAWDIVRDTLMLDAVESFKIVKPGPAKKEKISQYMLMQSQDAHWSNGKICFSVLQKTWSMVIYFQVIDRLVLKKSLKSPSMVPIILHIAIMMK